MRCREVRDLVDSFLSEQLLVETNHDIVRHLETCPDCRADVAARRELRGKIRSAFSLSSELAPRPEFSAQMATALRSERNSLSRRSLLKSWWALAAGAVLAAGGSLLVRGSGSRTRLAALARDAVGDHQNCAIAFNLAERPIKLDEAGRLYGGAYAALASFEPPAVDGPLSVLERHACVYQGRRFGHVVLRYRGGVASLLVTEADPPPAPELEPDAGRFRVAALPAGRYLGFVVTDVDRGQTLSLAQALADPLAQHLA
jgi:predicted anti-sigma-YlaC factor YlaD